MKASMKKPNCSSALSLVKPSALNIFSCKSELLILILPPPISSPLITMSYAFALTVSFLSSIYGISSTFGCVNGWCIAMYLPSSSLYSNSGKSVIQSSSNLSGSFKFNSLAISFLKLPRVFLTTDFLSASNKIKSLFFISISLIRASFSSSVKNFAIGPVNSLSTYLTQASPFAPNVLANSSSLVISFLVNFSW